MTDGIIDTSYDFRQDSNGYDPDTYSATLRNYHKILWTKSLPNGELFNLDDSVSGAYLYYESFDDTFHLSSDAITHSYSRWKRTKHLIEQVPKNEVDEFFSAGCTIGAYIIFPQKRAGAARSINQERGCNKRINDRFDLTLECIRRYYEGIDSPLQNILKAYDNYFALFLNFRGFCDFFLLQDLVSDDYSKIKFFLPFDQFVYNPLPANADEYLTYKYNSVEFIRKRNARIQSEMFLR